MWKYIYTPCPRFEEEGAELWLLLAALTKFAIDALEDMRARGTPLAQSAQFRTIAKGTEDLGRTPNSRDPREHI